MKMSLKFILIIIRISLYDIFQHTFWKNVIWNVLLTIFLWKKGEIEICFLKNGRKFGNREIDDVGGLPLLKINAE